MKINKIKVIIEKILNDNKAKNIITIDLKKKSFVADPNLIGDEEIAETL